MDAVLSDQARLQGMLDVEAALARAQANLDIIPNAAAAAIAAQCRAELFDLTALGHATALAGNVAIPLVKALTAQVAAKDAEAARFVHWGATSQDIIDTGLVLQLRAALDLIDADLEKLRSALNQLTQDHRATPMVGRTWMQHALPITFGLKAACWLDAINRHCERLQEIRPRVLALQLGGAAGTLASLGDKGVALSTSLANELKLTQPDLPWHGARDRMAEVATTLGLLVGTLGKIARDISLMMQTDVAEAYEPAGQGRGGSSTMPHKRNPVSCAVALAAAVRVPPLVSTMLSAMVQEHERGLGGWHAEWDTLPQIISLTAGALSQMTNTLAGLEVHPEKMRENLDTTQGLVLAEAVQMALASKIGRLAAHDLVEHACKRALADKHHLRAVLSKDAAVTQHLSPAELDQLFDPAHYQGVADQFIQRVLKNNS